MNNYSTTNKTHTYKPHINAYNNIKSGTKHVKRRHKHTQTYRHTYKIKTTYTTHSNTNMKCIKTPYNNMQQQTKPY